MYHFASYFNAFRILSVCAILCAMTNYLLAADPIVSNLTAAQRPGTKLVDITYDVTADTPTVGVTLRISSDGGTTFSVPATTLTGAVGANVPVGTGKVITWNAGTDWLGNYSTTMRFEVKVDDGVVPEGFAYVAAGALPASSWAGAQAVDGFFMGKTEVTWGEWQTVRTWAAANGYDIGSVGAGGGPNRPVTNLNWYHALKWCNARSEKEGLTPVYKVGSAVYRTGDAVPTVNAAANGYRLPSEWEWEFAARGGVKTNGYEYSGSNDINAVAWYSSNSGGSTQNVATKPANELGLSDMSGNVWEWCFDASGSDLVIRGGAWDGYAVYCPVAYRSVNNPPGMSNSYRGFRVARSSVLFVSRSLSVLVDTSSRFLNTGATVGGSITGQGNYDLSAPATITATPSPGYRFTGWTGDASGTDNPLTITMNADKNIGAIFEKDLSDIDSDGLTAYDELVLTQTNPLLADTDGDGTNDANSDQDGDGLSNRVELSYQGSYFTMVEGSFTQAQAAADAASRRGRLASFPNVNDFTRGAGKARKTTQGYLWFGLSDAATEGTWLWTDGSTPPYSRWLNGQPDGGTTENHAVLMEASTQWADAVADFVAAGYLFERVGLDPLATDTDGDGLSDGAESNTHQTNPVLDDSDSDGLTDGAEINTHGSNPKLSDTDSDGLSDFAEVVTHGTNPSAKDSDADGFDDLFEINTGFNPTQNSSTPDAVSSIRTAVEFRFNAGNGLRYRIEGSTDLQNWETVETNIIGTGGVVTRFYSIENQPKRYFRVVKVGGSSDPDGDGI
jgi:uncharacterized repeat protein (TIGR02543 family)